MIKIKEKNYKSDFDAILHLYRCRKDDSGEEVREEVDFPPYDWTARFYAGANKANPYVASCIGGVCTNCFNDDGKIHVVFNGHRMGLGRVSVEFTAQIPDAIYPDGLRQEVRPQPLDVELVNGPGDCGCDIDLAVVLPYAVVTAYESAVQAGFSGTAEEYYAGLSLLPALSAATSDLAAAKAEVAAALRLHGVDVADTDSLHDMADKVAHLRLAVPGEPGVVDHGWRGLGVPDLLNALRNNTRPADYPYMWAAATPERSVTLVGADAYLCSDGYYTTEQGVTHTFTDNKVSNWVIYYHSSPSYTIRNTIGFISDVCVLSGNPDYQIIDSTEYTTIGTVASYAEAAPQGGSPQSLSINATGVTALYVSDCVHIAPGAVLRVGSGFNAMSFPNLEICDSAPSISNAQIGQLRFPKLRIIKSNQYLVSNCPAIEIIDLPELTTTAGMLANGAPALTSVKLPSLRSFNASYVTEFIRGIKGLCNIYLTSWSESAFSNNGALIGEVSGEAHIHAPNLRSGRNALESRCTGQIHLHLGSQQDARIELVGSLRCHLHVAPGFRSSITTAYTYAGTTREELLELIANLADNTGHTTHTITLGATLLGLLTDDEIALATAKNYTLS